MTQRKKKKKEQRILQSVEGEKERPTLRKVRHSLVGARLWKSNQKKSTVPIVPILKEKSGLQERLPVEEGQMAKINSDAYKSSYREKTDTDQGKRSRKYALVRKKREEKKTDKAGRNFCKHVCFKKRKKKKGGERVRIRGKRTIVNAQAEKTAKKTYAKPFGAVQRYAHQIYGERRGGLEKVYFRTKWPQKKKGKPKRREKNQRKNVKKGHMRGGNQVPSDKKGVGNE